MKLTPAVELSYLPPEEQKQVAELIDIEGRTPSLSQAQQIKKLSQEKKLDEYLQERQTEGQTHSEKQASVHAQRLGRGSQRAQQEQAECR